MTTSRSRPALGVALVVASGALFALNGTVSKLLLRDGFDAPRLTELRASGACIGLLVLGVVAKPGLRRLAVTRRELPLLAGYGLAGFFLVPMLYFIAISRLPVGIALLFEYTAPLLVALWARFGQHQRVKPRLWAGLALSLLGLAAVAEVWGQIRLNGIGLAAGTGAAVLLAVYYVLGARGVAARDPLSLTWWAFGVAALAGAAVQPWSSFPYGLLARTWPLVLYLVCAGSIASYLLVAAALRHLPATSVGIIGMVEPVIASAIAWLVLDERLDAAQLAGGALIVVGVGLAETARTVGPDETPVATAGRVPGQRTDPAGTPDRIGEPTGHGTHRPDAGYGNETS